MKKFAGAALVEQKQTMFAVRCLNRSFAKMFAINNLIVDYTIVKEYAIPESVKTVIPLLNKVSYFLNFLASVNILVLECQILLVKKIMS